MIGDIMSISRLRMATDGQGVSTLVAFFGCPLKCKYCINNFCHEDQRRFLGTPRAAYTPKELVEVLKKDEIYYLMTGGGVVFGGGEPLLQSAFIYEVCKLIDGTRWIKRIETSLNVSWNYVTPLLDDIDEWIIDIKDMDCSIYEKYTGVNNEQVLDNLYRMLEVIPVEKVHIRVPNIPGFNTKEDVRNSSEWIKSVLGIEAEIFDYYALPHTVKIPD